MDRNSKLRSPTEKKEKAREKEKNHRSIRGKKEIKEANQGNEPQNS